MKPTRNIVKVNKGLWTPKHAVWFKKNTDYDDKPMTKKEVEDWYREGIGKKRLSKADKEIVAHSYGENEGTAITSKKIKGKKTGSGIFAFDPNTGKYTEQ